jgi:hypothetical protein
MCSSSESNASEGVVVDVVDVVVDFQVAASVVVVGLEDEEAVVDPKVMGGMPEGAVNVKSIAVVL